MFENVISVQDGGHFFSGLINPIATGNVRVRSQHCGLWCSGAKALGHHACSNNSAAEICIVLGQFHSKIL